MRPATRSLLLWGIGFSAGIRAERGATISHDYPIAPFCRIGCAAFRRRRLCALARALGAFGGRDLAWIWNALGRVWNLEMFGKCDFLNLILELHYNGFIARSTDSIVIKFKRRIFK